MNNKLDQLIDELEDILDNCKYRPLSNTVIMVDRTQIDQIIEELRRDIPMELAKSQKVVSNQQAILKQAREQAEALINEAAAKTNEMVNQNSIMKQAYEQADVVVKQAYAQAQEIMGIASIEANEMRTAAVDYVDNLLANYENVVANTLKITQGHYEQFYSQLNLLHETVVSNRAELHPPVMETAEIPQEYFEDTGSIPQEGIQTTGSLAASVPQNTQPLAKPATGDTADIKLDLL